jgi:phage terminase small subunit
MSDRHESRALKINRRHEEYARRLLADTGTPEWQIYKEVFGCASDNVTSLRVAASQLKHHPNFAAYLDTVRAEIGGKFMITVESLIAELDEIKQIAISAETPQCSAAVNAVMSKAKLAGLDRKVEEKSVGDNVVEALLEMAKRLPG